MRTLREAVGLAVEIGGSIAIAAGAIVAGDVVKDWLIGTLL